MQGLQVFDLIRGIIIPACPALFLAIDTQMPVLFRDFRQYLFDRLYVFHEKADCRLLQLLSIKEGER